MATESVADTHAPSEHPRTAARAVPRPKPAPLWIVLVTGASAGVFTLGVLRALTASPRNGVTITFSSRQMALYAVVAVVGRVLSAVIQSEIICSISGRSGKLRAVRRGVMISTFRAQVPLAVRDVILGTLGMTGVLTTSRLVGLALSPLDPFMILAVVIFYRSVRTVGLSEGRGDALRAVVAFAAFLYFVKVALLLLSAAG